MNRQEFLEFVFGEVYTQPEESEHVLLTQKGTGFSTQHIQPQQLRTMNFFCVSTVSGELIVKNAGTSDEYSYVGRTNDHLVAAYCVILDDVGTKSKTPDVTPHWKMETSEGNFQWGYLINAVDVSGEKQREYYESCIRGLAQAGYSDPGAHGAARIMRLPGGRKERGGFKAQIVEYKTENELPAYELPELMARFEVQPVTSAKTMRLVVQDDDADVQFFQWVDGLCADRFHLGFRTKQVRDVLRVLKELSPDLPYNDWLMVGQALRSDIGNDQFAYQIFHRWSREGQSYDPSEWPSKWESFDKRRGGVSLRSVFNIAQRHKVEMPERDLPTDAEMFRDMNRQCCYIGGGNKARVMVLPSHLDRKVHPGIMWESHDLKSFESDFAPLRTLSPGRDGLPTPTGKVGPRWLAHEYRQRYTGIELAPPPYSATEGKFNLWQGWPIEPDEGACPLFEAHVREVLGAESAECGDYLMNFFAWTVQHPGKLPAVMVVLRGARGTGKSIVSMALAKLFGAHGKVIDSDDGITGRFNRQLEGALFVALEEAGWAGDRRGQGKMKSIITSRTVVIEPKGVDPYEVRNGATFVLTTNHDWAVPAAEDERRFAVFDVSKAHQQDKSYFRALSEEMDDLPRLLGFLQRYEVPESWHPADCIPRTGALIDQQDLSAFTTESYVRGFLTTELAKRDPFHDRLRLDQRLHADPYGEGDILRGEEAQKHGAEIVVPTAWFLNEVTQWVKARNRGYEPHVTAKKVAAEMRDLFPGIRTIQVPDSDGVRRRYWPLTNLETLAIDLVGEDD